MKRLLGQVLIIGMLLVPTALGAQENSCYQATIGKKTLTYTGAVWREILNGAAQSRVKGARDSMLPLPENQKPVAKKCQGAADLGKNGLRLVQAPDLSSSSASYYGDITSAGQFRKLAELKCGADAIGVNQYFSVDGAIFYRDCAARVPMPGGGGQMQNNPGLNYIYFWGWTNPGDIPCMDVSYPVMYSKALSTNPKLSLDDLRRAETKGKVRKLDKKGNEQKLDAGDVALAADVAAELVAESWRDNNLKYINVMLLDIAKARNKGPEIVLAGYCPPLGQKMIDCKNTSNQGKGIHPLAWGGAEKLMTKGQWGRKDGADSEFGKNYESGLIGEWLIDMQKGKQLPANSKCTSQLPGDNDPDRVSVVKVFDLLVGN